MVDRAIDGGGIKKNFTLSFYLDSLDGILDLEQPPLGAESVDAPVVLRAGEEHRWSRERVGEKESFFLLLLSFFFLPRNAK